MAGPRHRDHARSRPGCRAAARRSRRPGRSISRRITGARAPRRVVRPALAARWPRRSSGAARPYRIGGSLPYAYEVKAETAGARSSDAWHATGLVGRDALTIDAVDAYTLDGRIRGAGRGWTGDQTWRFTVASPLARSSRGCARISTDASTFEGSIEGRGFGTNAPLTARVASLHGVLWGRSLTGSGEIERRDGSYELRAVRVANGDSYARVDGRYGPTLDLVLDADLRSLAIIDPQISGRLTARGRAQGRPPDHRSSARLRSRRSGTRMSSLAAQRHKSISISATRGVPGWWYALPRSTAGRCGSTASSSAPAGAPRSTSCRSKPHRLATSATVSPGSRPGLRRAELSRSTGAAGTASSRRRSSASRMAAQTCCSRRRSIFRPRQRAPRRSVSRPARHGSAWRVSGARVRRAGG